MKTTDFEDNIHLGLLVVSFSAFSTFYVHPSIFCLSRYKSRQYCVGLSARGRDAISRVEGLWEAVQQGGVPTSQFVVHTGSKSIPLKRNPDKPSLLINQRTLAAILVSELRRRYSNDEVQVSII